MEHVEELKWHRFPTKDEDRKRKWASLVAKGRCEFVPTDNGRICSNHFPDKNKYGMHGMFTFFHANPPIKIRIPYFI